jgi:hypothetical protein
MRDCIDFTLRQIRILFSNGGNKMRLYFRFMVFLIAVLLPVELASSKDSDSSLSISGDIQKPAQWSADALKKQFADRIQSVKFAAGKDKQQKTGMGIPLLSIIQSAALKTDPNIGHHDLKFLVILEAKDSYQAFFPIAELTPAPGGSPLAFLVWEVDGKPLSDTDAPLRLILTMGGESRQIRGVTSITLVDGVKLANQLKKKQ